MKRGENPTDTWEGGLISKGEALPGLPFLRFDPQSPPPPQSRLEATWSEPSSPVLTATPAWLSSQAGVALENISAG